MLTGNHRKKIGTGHNGTVGVGLELGFRVGLEPGFTVIIQRPPGRKHAVLLSRLT